MIESDSSSIQEHSSLESSSEQAIPPQKKAERQLFTLTEKLAEPESLSLGEVARITFQLNACTRTMYEPSSKDYGLGILQNYEFGLEAMTKKIEANPSAQEGHVFLRMLNERYIRQQELLQVQNFSREQLDVQGIVNPSSKEPIGFHPNKKII
jgi:hypothetical protein